nr:MAG TPA: hypothetical protein [Caudoviricetes sp.]
MLTVTSPFVLRNGNGLDATLRMPTSSFLKLRREADLPEPLSPKIKTAMPISHHSFLLLSNSAIIYFLSCATFIAYICNAIANSIVITCHDAPMMSPTTSTFTVGVARVIVRLAIT